MLDDASSDTHRPFGLAAVVAKDELIEIGLQVLVAHGAGVRPEEPALQERDRPVAALDRIALAPLDLGLHGHLVRPFAQALVAVAGVSVGHDVGVDRDSDPYRKKITQRSA